MENVNDFVEFYKKIPEELWCENVFEDGKKRCALGHLGERLGKEHPDSFLLETIFRSVNYPITEGDPLKYNGKGVRDVNDGRGCEELGKSPKERILSVLNMAIHNDRLSNS